MLLGTQSLSLSGHAWLSWVPLSEMVRIPWLPRLPGPDIACTGRGTGVVIATGTETEFGIIFSMMQDVEEKRTPLQLNMDELAKKLSIMSFGVIGVICVIGVLQKRSWLEMFTIGGWYRKSSYQC